MWYWWVLGMLVAIVWLRWYGPGEPELASAWLEVGGRRRWVTFLRYQQFVMTIRSSIQHPLDEPMILFVKLRHHNPNYFKIECTVIRSEAAAGVRQYDVRPRSIPAIVHTLLLEAFPQSHDR